jgi:predicted metal-dependent hydrolase
LIPYSVRESPRARRVRLVMSAHEGLVVVVPRGFDWSRVPGILEEKQQWISRAAADVERKRRLAEPAEASVLPESIDLRYLDEVWRVEYRPSANGSTSVRAREAADLVVRVTGNIGDDAACRRALTRWLARKGQQVLVPAAQELAWAHGFGLQRVTVRRQRTRWGSCSRDRSLSLNVKLLFLPPELVDYVLLHELCHTVHMNHSRAFWTLLRESDPDVVRHRRELRLATELVPGWLSRAGNDVMA